MLVGLAVGLQFPAEISKLVEISLGIGGPQFAFVSGCIGRKWLHCMQ